MTYRELIDNRKSIKVRKVRGRDEWNVLDMRYYGSKVIASFPSKDEAEDFAERRVLSDH